MKNYNDLIRLVRDTGARESNRTGIDTLTLPGEMLKFDTRDGFPATTSKKLAFDPVKGELIGFMRGYTSAAQFRALGCRVWNQNANENEAWLKNPHRKGVDDLGPVYGSQWRNWPSFKQLDENAPLHLVEKIKADNWEEIGDYHFADQHRVFYKHTDQLANALHDVRHNSQSRRILVSAWNPAVMDQVALPACHVLFQFLPRSDGTLHMTVIMRSVDMFLGAPFNIASYALLLELFAKWSDRTAATLTMFLSDVHIYVNHLDLVEEMLSRTPFDPPELDVVVPVGAAIMSLDELVLGIEPNDIQLLNYKHHPSIKAPMAV